MIDRHPPHVRYLESSHRPFITSAGAAETLSFRNLQTRTVSKPDRNLRWPTS